MRLCDTTTSPFVRQIRAQPELLASSQAEMGRTIARCLEIGRRSLVIVALSACGRPAATATLEPVPGRGVVADGGNVASACPRNTSVVPPGNFAMGQRGAREPVHVDAFCIDRSEVTIAEYATCVEAGSCTPPRGYDDAVVEWKRQSMCNWKHPEGRAAHPVNCVTWAQASSYCAFVHGRLPTEEEWEWAARGGDADRQYPWGDTPPDLTRANACGAECPPVIRAKLGQDTNALYASDDGFAETAPVGSYPRGDNRWGIHDLAGNVSEWTQTRLSPNGEHRMIRGGNFETTYPDYLRATSSDAAHPTMADPSVGFRCVR